MNYVKLKIRVPDKAILQRVKKIIEDKAEELCDQAMFDPVALHTVNVLDSLANSMGTVEWPSYDDGMDPDIIDALAKNPNE